VAPLVSIVLPVHAPDRRWFREAVESVLAQTFRDLELIIVEDPSDRSGRDLLAGLDDARIRHVVNPTRTSLPEQHNLGLSLAQGRYICRFDADDVCEPDRVAREVAFLDAHPDVDIVASALTIVDDEGRPIAIRRYPLAHEEIVRTMRRSNPIANSAVMFRREVFERFGGWRTGSPLPAQDYEWYSRLAAGGARFANLSEPLVRYRLHAQSIKSTKLRGTILTTLEVKRTYWRDSMDFASRLVMLAERMLLFVPAPLVLWLFRVVRYRRSSYDRGRS
jgi:glycosyltransferase involved in cell wall biosynthesis